MNTNEVLDFINGFGKTGGKITDLSRIQSLLDLIDNPQDRLKFIHVAGTNGKGSICEMLTDIFISASIKTATFTSPYIIEYKDRIRVDGKNIDDESLCQHAITVRNAVAKSPLINEFSQFEITMCIALLYFVECGCEVVIWETGMGGLLDCTNVIKAPLVSIIASVAMDHMGILGDTIEKITYQKAGIIKENCPVVLSSGNCEAVVQIISDTASQKNSNMVIPSIDDCVILNSSLTSTEFMYNGKKYSLSMCGEHQVSNAITVIEAIRLIKDKFVLTQDNVVSGLANAKIHARTEVISRSPLIILDGGHNPDGFSALAEVLKNHTESPRYAVMGILTGKDVSKSVSQLIGIIDEFYCVDGFLPTAVNADELCSIVRSMGGKAKSFHNVNSAVKALYDRLKCGETGVICGSLYLASYVLNSD